VTDMRYEFQPVAMCRLPPCIEHSQPLFGRQRVALAGRARDKGAAGSALGQVLGLSRHTIVVHVEVIMHRGVNRRN